jgi:hypothetical protein
VRAPYIGHATRGRVEAVDPGRNSLDDEIVFDEIDAAATVP